MITIDEMEVMLEEIANDFPKELYNKLNGGIILLPEEKQSPMSKKDDLYILGQYHVDRMMGRYIVIYYGSFVRLFGTLNYEILKAKLIHTLKHEFIHHLESLAGEHGLEIEDRRFIEEYLNRKV
ncbi:MAG: metallopeptidase family protein [Clostridiales bacterium]|nr:metallopeptidase family protein [Clostridiales bacterium]